MVKLLLALPLFLEPLWLIKLAVLALTIAFSLLFSAASLSVVRTTVQWVNQFFSAPKRRLRQLARIQVRRQHAKELFLQKTAQINYFSELKRKKLLAKDNNKHMDGLTKAICHDLSVSRKRLPKLLSQDLQRQFRQAQKQRDAATLIHLQTKIALLNEQTCQK